MLCCLLAPTALAQTITVKGTVIDALHQEPIIGATVMLVEDTSKGILTDFDGHFSLTGVPAKGTLRVSYVGYKTIDVAIDGRSNLTIVLEEDNELLDEVVVTALGIKRSEKALSYNVQEVKSDALTTVKNANFMNSLAGKVAGVNINASSAGIGGATRVVMRGPKSISANNQALYVVDGIPLFNVNKGEIESSAFANQPGSEGIADINPDDIESLSVLSGPAAAALYGSAAAQGVIMITTKKGTAGSLRVSFSNSSTFSNPFVLPEFQDSYINRPGEIRTWGEQKASQYGSYDPSDFFRTGTNIQNTLALTIGGEKSQTYLSLGSTNSTGIMPNSGYNRYNVTVRNTTSFLNDLLTLDVNLNYINSGDKNLMAQGQYYNPLTSLYLFPRGENFDAIRVYEQYDPTRQIYLQNWRYGETLKMQNPYWIMHRMVRTNNRERYMLAGTLTYRPLEWLNVVGRVRYDNAHNKAEDKRHAGTALIFSYSPYGYYSYENGFDKAVYADVMANINKDFGEEFSLSANIGGSTNYTSQLSEGFKGGLKAPSNIFAPHAIQYARGTTSNAPLYGGVKHLIYSAFVSAELGYNRMAYLTVTGRNDWDSALEGTTHESFFYPSVGLSTILTEMIDMPREYVSYLKVRGSWASVGSAISPNLTSRWKYQYNPETQGYETSTYRFPDTFYPERTNSFEVGLTGRFFEDILSVDFTWYQSNTKNQTFLRPLSGAQGYNNEYIQTGDVRNRGVELSLGLDFQWGDFGWNPSFVFSANRNKIIELLPDENETIDKGGLESISVILKKGGTMGDIYDFSSIKTDQEGYPLVDNNQIVAEKLTNPVYRGTVLPLANMSLVNEFTYKGLNFGFLISARLGGIVMSQTQAYLDYFGVSKASADLRDQGGVSVNLGMISAEQYYDVTAGDSPLWRNYIYDATNVRLQEAHIGYNLPARWINENASIQLGLTGHNLLMLFKRAPFDPELSASTGTYYQGFDYFMQPGMRSMGFNIKVNL
ncbi:MAG: SusC/RagA family TonB-linked outer membrane protein [Porphyromonas sp.]|nr:SusC/RagA family TonB-linked outer membrane protein [Porphyromonas sp.]